MYVSGIPLTAIIGNYFRISTRLSILQATNLCEHFIFLLLDMFIYAECRGFDDVVKRVVIDVEV